MNQLSTAQLQKAEAVRTLAARLQVSGAQALRILEESASRLSKEQDARVARLNATLRGSVWE